MEGLALFLILIAFALLMSLGFFVACLTAVWRSQHMNTTLRVMLIVSTCGVVAALFAAGLIIGLPLAAVLQACAVALSLWASSIPRQGELVGRPPSSHDLER